MIKWGAEVINELLQVYGLEDHFNKYVVASENFTADHTTDILVTAAVYATGDMVRLTNTGGSLPTGLLADTDYFVIIDTTTSIKLALTYENALLGTFVAFTTNGTGTHSIQTLSYKWIDDRVNNWIIPWLMNRTSLTFDMGIQQITEYHDGNGTNVLILDKRPVVDLISISYTDGTDYNTRMEPGGFLVIKSEGIIKSKSAEGVMGIVPVFSKGSKNIEVVYTIGSATIQPQIKEAIKFLAAENVLAHIGSETGGGDISTQGFSRSFGTKGKYTSIRNDFTKRALAILCDYMTAVVGS